LLHQNNTFSTKIICLFYLLLFQYISIAKSQNLNDTVINISGNKTEIKLLYQNGQVKEIIKLKNNKKHGTQKHFSNAGVLLSEINYKNGLLCGTHVTFNNEGKIIEKKQYRVSPTKQTSWLHGKYLLYSGKVIITKGLYKDSLKDGKWFEYYNNGTLKSLIEYKNGIQKGTQINYNNNGEVQYRCNYAESLEQGKKVAVKHGSFVSYYNKQVSSEGAYNMGKKTGLWREYNQKGELYREIFYKNGKVHGINNSYNNEGKLEQKSEFYEEIEINGKKLTNVFHGIKERYKSNGKLESRENYNYGQKEGTWETYYANGNLRETNTYRNNLQIAKSIGYDEDGSKIYDCSYEIIKQDSVLKSVKTGIEMRWLKNILVFETSYKNGKENGIRKTYYPSGKLAQTQQFIDDLLQGESIEYFENGNIKSKRNYNSIITASNEKKFNQIGWIINMDEDGNLTGKLFYDSLGNRVIHYSYHQGKLDQLYIDKVLECNFFPNGKLMSEKLISNTSLMPFARYYYMNGTIRKIGFQNVDNQIYNSLHFKNDGSFHFASSSFYNKPDTLLPATYLISSITNAAGGNLKENIFYSDSIKNGAYTIFYNNGKVYAKMNFTDDLPDGDFVFYHPENGDTLLFARFSKGLLNGPWLEKFGGKKVWLRGAYCHQKMCGTWTRNQPNGMAYEIRRYNKKSGQSAAITEFYPNGNLKTSNDYETGAYENRDEKGNIITRSIVIDGMNKEIQSETYYPNTSILKSRNRYKNNIQDGYTESFYQSGKLQSKMPYVNGKRNGTYYEYFENGDLKRMSTWEEDKLEGMGIVVSEQRKIDTLYYKNNNLQVKPSGISCACVDTTHSSNRIGFAPSISSLLEYDALQSYFPKYLTPVDSLNYRSIFYTGFQNSNGTNSGFSAMNLMLFKEFAFYLPSNQQIKLVFNPCITKGYISRMEVSANYGIGNRNYTNVDFYPKKIALEFMKGPVKSNDKNHENFKVILDTKNVSFNPEKKLELDIKTPENYCFTPAKIKDIIDINILKGKAYIFEKYTSAVFDRYQLKISEAELDLFFGVVVEKASVNIEIYGPKGYETIEANSDFMMLGGEFACGVIKINCTKNENEVYSTVANKNKFIVTDIREALEKKGFSRINFTYGVAEKQLWFTFYTE
jgi:antitoxin component YwqK of YwqJK toxin-antitoxin module